MKNNPDVIASWEKSHTLASLNKLYEVVISEQSTYLKSLKLTEQPSNLPLCEVLKANQDKFIISAKNGIDMKVTVDAMAYLVNVDNLVKVGNQIIQYNYDDIKIIENGDVSKVATLSTTKVTAGNVFVGKVERTSNLISKEVKTKGGRTEYTSVASCDSRDNTWNSGGSYLHPDAVIAYLEEISYRCTVCPPPPLSIGGHYNTYHAQIKLRSLSNYWPFGWYNYTTYNLHSEGTVVISWQPTGFYEDEITGINQTYSTPSYSSPVHTRTHTFLYINLLNTQIPQWDLSYGHYKARGNYTVEQGFCSCIIW